MSVIGHPAPEGCDKLRLELELELPVVVVASVLEEREREKTFCVPSPYSESY